MSRKLYPIWGPQDSVTTAEEFAAWADTAEVGELVEFAEHRRHHHQSILDRMFTQSRHRKAAIMDGAAVTLFMSFMAFFGAIVYTLATR